MSDATWKNPTPTVDVLIELAGRPGTLVFIERKNEPHGFALPGGFVDEGEWVADAGPWLGRRYLSEVGRHFDRPLAHRA